MLWNVLMPNIHYLLGVQLCCELRNERCVSHDIYKRHNVCKKITIYMRTNNHYCCFKQLMKAFSGRRTLFEVKRQRIDIDDFVCHAE